MPVDVLSNVQEKMISNDKFVFIHKGGDGDEKYLQYKPAAGNDEDWAQGACHYEFRIDKDRLQVCFHCESKFKYQSKLKELLVSKKQSWFAGLKVWTQRNKSWIVYDDDNKEMDIERAITKMIEFSDKYGAKILELVEKSKKENPMENRNGSAIEMLLHQKKNIILQGAPGTGKTYRTAELALSVIGKLPSRNVGEDEKSFHKRVMDAYDAKIIKLNWDGSFANPEAQIGFVTFHQSMDYEDFVEGIKPIKPDEGEMYYKVENGIFKIMSRVATNPQQVKQEKTLNSAFDDLIQDIIEGNVKSLPMKNGGRSSELSVSSQMTIKWKAGNGNVETNCVSKERLLKLCEVYDSKEKIGAIPNIQESIRNVIGGCNSSYYWAVANYLLNKIGKGTISNEKIQNYVLIIDEINRGNISKIFGELISLLEADKRVGGDHPLSVTLPYSKESFSVPSNLYIIGTMNTTDRSVGSIDYAVRRRFAFVTLEADESKAPEGDARNLFNAVKNFLNKSKYDMDIEDLMVGHSYFMNAANLQMKWQYEILPLLVEYHKDGIISKSPLNDFSEEKVREVKVDYKLFIEKWSEKKSEETQK